MMDNKSKQPQDECKEKEKEPHFKSRYFVLLIAFFGEIFMFYHRLTMSIGLVAMVNSSVSSSDVESKKSCLNLIEDHGGQNQTTENLAQVNGEFQWSDQIQGYILGSGYLSVAISLPISAKLAEMYGGKRMFVYCMFLSSFLTFISPFAAYWSVYALISAQFLRGMTQGGLVPAPVMLIVNWFPKQERGLVYTTLISGGPAGAVLGSYISGILCDSTFLGGWPSAFYVSGFMGFVLSIIAFFFLHDNPSVHPRISPVELNYILSNQESVMTEKRPKTPWNAMFKSIPFWALCYTYFGSGWANSQFLSANPIFLKEILHFSISKDGLFNALPFLVQIFTSNIVAVLSAILIKNGYISIDKSRKLWTFISFSGFSLCIMGIYFAGCDRFYAVLFSIIALAFIGFSYAGCLVAITDMSPTFAASMECITCMIGLCANVSSPVIVGYLTNGSQTLEQWNKIFFISIGVVLSSGLVFAAFGSAKIQPWNEVSEEKSQDMEEKEKKIDVFTI